MFEFLKTLVNIQIKDIEADVFPTPECIFGGKGEVEFELFQNGNASIEFEVKRTTIPDGTVVEVLGGGNYIGELVVQGGRAKQCLKFEEGQSQPQLEIGDTAEMIIHGQVCYVGTFCQD